MSELYKKMYATVVGEVDETIQLIAKAILDHEYGFEMMSEIGQKLKKALLDAEDMYLDAEED